MNVQIIVKKNYIFYYQVNFLIFFFILLVERTKEAERIKSRRDLEEAAFEVIILF